MTGGTHPTGSPHWESTEAGAHLRGRQIRDTDPEVKLRRALHARGLRYRLGRRVGRFHPDVVFPGSQAVLFVDGCFWHGCPTHGPKEFRGPNAAQWQTKLEANRARDEAAVNDLTGEGWTVIRVWECEIKADAQLAAARVHVLLQEAAAAATSR